jgi:hypothetical protein
MAAKKQLQVADHALAPVALNEKSRPSFSLLENHRGGKHPVVYYAFDLVETDVGYPDCSRFVGQRVDKKPLEVVRERR